MGEEEMHRQRMGWLALFVAIFLLMSGCGKTGPRFDMYLREQVLPQEGRAAEQMVFRQGETFCAIPAEQLGLVSAREAVLSGRQGLITATLTQNTEDLRPQLRLDWYEAEAGELRPAASWNALSLPDQGETTVFLKNGYLCVSIRGGSRSYSRRNAFFFCYNPAQDGENPLRSFSYLRTPSRVVWREAMQNKAYFEGTEAEALSLEGGVPQALSAELERLGLADCAELLGDPLNSASELDLLTETPLCRVKSTEEGRLLVSGEINLP